MAPKRKRAASPAGSKRVTNTKAAVKSVAVLDKFKEEACCPICYELFEVPVTLLCGHNFCGHCFKEAFEADENCPTCRNEVSELPSENKLMATFVDHQLKLLEKADFRSELGK